MNDYALGRDDGWGQVSAVLKHEIDGLVIQHHAVFDRTDAGPHGRFDAGGAVRMCGGVDAVHVGNFDDGGDFVSRQLLCADGGADRHDAAG